ncbi:AraC family transcriptional regulator [Psychroserpens sp. AS72]|uniref:helix-turn-helix domain-containing protein n=1 Tax=Psychroserpens sp. AS72 TaxID=3135775 RepID=UPI00316D70F9
MVKLSIFYNDLLDSFDKISNVIGDKHTKEAGFGYTNLKNSIGDGVISVSVISKDISVLILDVTLVEELELTLNGDSSQIIDFIFCLEGHIQHKFSSNSNYTPINFRQNTIAKRSNKTKTELKFPKDVPLKVSIISYIPLSGDIDSGDFSELRSNAFNVLSKVYAKENFLYSGRICFRTSNYVNDILKYSVNDTKDILFKEAAILNAMASQIDRHSQDLSNNHKDAPLRLYEIDKISALETFVENNLTESLTLRRLEMISGLNSTKLQAGFKYLYDKTVSVYVTEKRLEKAAKLIFESDLNVTELVYSVGFSSRSYFTKIFKNHYGVLPSQCKSNPELLSIKS